MEFFPYGSKHVKEFIQSGTLNPGEVELADSQGNGEPNANWTVKPNFNLNLVSSCYPYQTMDTSTLDGQTKNYDGTKVGGKSKANAAVAIQIEKSSSPGTPIGSPVEKDDSLQLKSKIPALSRSQMSEGQLNCKVEQKSPNLKHTPTLCQKTLSNSRRPANPKSQLLMVAGSPRMTNKEKSQAPQVESASVSNPKPPTVVKSEETTRTTKSLKLNTNKKDDGGISLDTHAPNTLHTPLSSRTQKQKEDSKLANQRPTLTTQTQKTAPVITMPGEKTKNDFSSEIPTLGSKLQNQRDGTALLSTKAPQTSSLSPKPSTQRKTSGTRTRNASGSKEDFDSRDSSIESKTQSKDSLESKTGSVSKTSSGSKDSLDIKTGSSFKTSSNKSGMGSRDRLDSKTGLDSSKLGPVLNSSKSAGAALSLPLALSPRPISAKRSPGSGPAKSLGPIGPNREAQRSPGAARGN